MLLIGVMKQKKNKNKNDQEKEEYSTQMI